jgi:hypothetical protein
LAKVDQASRELRVADAIQHIIANGAVAQLGERELCKLEVIGSIPFSSTNYLIVQSGFEVEAGLRKLEAREHV